ncbi:LapD/MoxY N-terminal periplasmic domain-containing protein [Campylobacter sp. 19-13652]|uniref:bifunctional diguanylate cyclase/phosphodiesterase n=1 Tax=Campylobacter sp. 19-13652 TaxID=2840180 RepID=UPI001C746815|nr:LapD/MoxY N-terminal periplasmic domain-containing protein [Campylobacter sp. 19-13652]BCX79004.1 GGDEF domain-containing protein [Campylobacter sp. 19-13652]
MTLFKQMMIAVGSFVLLIFVAVAYLNFNSLNSYINAQLGTNARHTANSMGLAIKSVAEFQDPSAIETIINSMFDSGYYQMIRFDDIDGKTVAESKQLPVIDGIPSWFISFAKFEAPVESSEIMSGWSKFGTLYVQSNPGLAYYELYTNMKDVFYTLLIMMAVALVATYLGLKIILAPLARVQDQAEAILDNKFIIQEKIPFTTDMRQMVLAMNSMVSKVKDVFEREAKTLDKYQELLYKDSMSGLYNRRYFQTKFSEYASSEEYSSGVMLLVSFKELINLKKTLGFEKWQSLVLKIAEMLNNASSESKYSATLCRLNENDFALLIPSASAESLQGLAAGIMKRTAAMFGTFGIGDGECEANAVIVDYKHGGDLKTLLTTADVTLASARAAGNYEYRTYKDGSNTLILGKEQYKDLIINSMKNDKFKFASQKVISEDGSFTQEELYLRLVDDEGRWQMAGYFMPMVNELDFGRELDIYVLERVAKMVLNGAFASIPVAVNLGKDLLVSTDALNKLDVILKQLSLTKHKIYIEIPNKDDISLQNIEVLDKKLKENSLGFGIDHFGLDAKSIDKLKVISPDYVKIQAANLIDFFSDNTTEHTKRSLDVILESKGIKLVAIGVENEEQKQKLISFGISIMQGNYIDNTKNVG